MLFSEFAAPYLQLADDAAKAALFAVVSRGFALVAYAKYEFVVEIASNEAAETDGNDAATELACIAETAIGTVLGGIPGKCTCHWATRW